MKISTRKIAIAGLLSATTIFLGQTQLGFISLPNGSGAATIMHIPTIIGGALGGISVGCLTGFMFAIYSFIFYGSFLPNPIAIFLPRILIGIFSVLIYRNLASKNRILGSIIVAIVGTLINSVGVLGLGYLFRLLSLEIILGILAINLPVELILSVFLVTAILPPIDKVLNRSFEIDFIN